MVYIGDAPQQLEQGLLINGELWIGKRIAELQAQVEMLCKSNGKKFTAALNVIDTDYHITLCFDDCAKAGKVSTSAQTGEATVVDVVYWEHCDLTVALVRSDFCDERAEYWAKNGYGYDLGYKPHFTIGKGDCTGAYRSIVGNTYRVGEEYCRVFDVGVNATPAQCLGLRDAEIKGKGAKEFVNWYLNNGDLSDIDIQAKKFANQQHQTAKAEWLRLCPWL